MKPKGRWREVCLLALVGMAAAVCCASAGPFWKWYDPAPCVNPGCLPPEGPPLFDVGGHWYWLRSPDEEKRVVAALYNRYCVRCHGVDGRGVWDMPDVPNFANGVWQASRSDGQLARIILEGRGAVMPPFRGTLTLEEGWAMARYLRTFLPGTEASRPDHGNDDSNQGGRTKKSAAGPKK